MTAPQSIDSLKNSSINLDEWWDINKHVSYHSIEPTSNSKRVDLFSKDKLLDKCEWVVTEKIHGSNFSFITNGKQIKCATRSKPLSDSEKFYGFQKVKETLSTNIIKLWEIMSSKNLIHSISNDNNNDDEKIIIIFGELFGGRYTHPNIKPLKSSIMCQYGIEYCPQNDFMSFDIYDGKDFLDYDIMINLFEESGLPYLKSLFRGSFNDAFNYDPEFTTTIPGLLGLPPLPFQNKAEGVIIKPVLTLRTTTKKRVILKIKTSDFEERVRTKKREIKEESKKKAREPLIEMYEEFLTFINENRLNNVVSKFGPVVIQNHDDDGEDDDDESKLNKRIDQVVELLCEDALTDLNKDDTLKEKFDQLPIWKQNYIVKGKGKDKALEVVKEYVEKVKGLHLNNNNIDKEEKDKLDLLGDSDDNLDNNLQLNLTI
ncbi:hypothetical protein C1645_795269 [Glomus cerebriforme]|uniref:RNA ligase domain-containing protein n=1 Tax=Glomus cerebriforme TaxID=658196 RepID=A0A397RXF1_9GLOM|nr:hypothetical protein C1645_795269 [Glomus cerebriforme]